MRQTRVRIRKPNSNPIPRDLAEDYLLLSGASLWRHDRDLAARKIYAEMLRALHEFLNRHGLYRVQQANAILPVAFEVRRDRVTEHGFQFLWRYLDGYLKHCDRAGTRRCQDYLESAWKKFVLTGRGHS